MSINCKDLPIRNYYSAENGHVRLDSLVPTATMFVHRKGDVVTISGTEWANDMSFDLSNHNVKFLITKNGFRIYDIIFPNSQSRAIYNIPEHKLQQLEELKKLLTA